jgi:ATP-dependent Zn protease
MTNPFRLPLPVDAIAVVQPNVGRYTTGVWTRQYLEQQLRLVLAGRAAEELAYGIDEMSSLHQHRIMQARQVRMCRVQGFEPNTLRPACIDRTNLRFPF